MKSVLHFITGFSLISIVTIIITSFFYIIGDLNKTNNTFIDKILIGICISFLGALVLYGIIYLTYSVYTASVTIGEKVLKKEKLFNSEDFE